MPRVFLVTGASSGLGHCLVQEILDRGEIAVATARRPEGLKFHNTKATNYLPLRLDVRDNTLIQTVFQNAIEAFGRVDVVVNNAGYGLAGPFEEASDLQIRSQIDVNLIGVMAVTRKAMEVMREQRPCGGLIQQIASVSGQVGIPFVSIYNATKWAVEGFTEAVSQEVKPEWGINFTIVEPGDLRTDWGGRSIEIAENRISAYEHIDAKDWMSKYDGTQPYDPRSAAKVIYESAGLKVIPLRLAVGEDAYEIISKKIADYKNHYSKYEHISKSVDRL